MISLKEHLKQNFDEEAGIFFNNLTKGYWSNFSESDQEKIYSELSNNRSLREIIKDHFPQYYEMIFDKSRCAGLELLHVKVGEMCSLPAANVTCIILCVCYLKSMIVKVGDFSCQRQIYPPELHISLCLVFRLGI